MCMQEQRAERDGKGKVKRVRIGLVYGEEKRREEKRREERRREEKRRETENE